VHQWCAVDVRSLSMQESLGSAHRNVPSAGRGLACIICSGDEKAEEREGFPICVTDFQ
jgi:hypothetical protein